LWSFTLPTKIIFGADTLKRLKDCVDEIKPKKIFLVTGRSSMEKLGITSKIKSMLDYEIVVFNQVEPNPSDTTVDKGIMLCRENNCDLVIGLGGGSAMDAGKTIAILAENNGLTKEYLRKEKTIEHKGIPYIAVPTTAGTGSEADNAAVITDSEIKKKLVVRHDYMYPCFAIVDPELTMSMPRKLTAVTGLDALSHALETYWSKKANSLIEAISLKAIELIYHNLPNACEQPKIIYRENMSLASTLAGISLAIGTNVMHSISYPLTIRYGIPHGHACGLTIIETMTFNADAIPEKMKAIANITGTSDIHEGIENFRNMINNLGLPMRLSELGVDKNDIPLLAEESITRRLELNPKPIEPKDIEKILLKIY